MSVTLYKVLDTMFKTGKEDDPCDDWSEQPIPKPKGNKYDKINTY